MEKEMNQAENVKVLLLGATGMLGAEVLNVLNAQSQYSLGLFIRHPHLMPAGKYPLIFHGDVLLPDSLKTPVEWADVVINCSGFVSYQRRDKQALHQVNVAGLSNLATACALYGKPLLHTSSALFYGSTPEPHVFTEEEELVDVYRGNYASSKYHSDHIVMSAGCRYIILRPGTLVNTLRKLYHFYKKGWKVNLKGGASFAPKKEVAQAYAMALELLLTDEPSQVFNLGGNNVSFDEVFAAFQRIQPRKTFLLANGLIDGLSRVNDFLLEPLLGKSVVTRENYLTGNRFTFINSEKAIEKLAYTIPSFEDTLKRVLSAT